MMKTVLFCAVVLSLLTVGWTAPMVCEKLLKPSEKEVDFNGTWYVISISTESWEEPFIHWLFGPSVSVDFTPKGPMEYDANIKLKVYGFCHHSTETVNKLSNNAPYSYGNYRNDYLGPPLHTDCPDCVVMKSRDSIRLLSRRTVVTAAEMMEFEKQAECLGWAKAQAFNTDHDTENCRTPDQETRTKIEEFGRRMGELSFDLLFRLFRILDDKLPMWF